MQPPSPCEDYEEEEDRLTARLIDAHRAEVAAGRVVLLPEWLADAVADGFAPLRAIRERAGETRAALAERTGLSEGELDAIERGAGPARDTAVETLAAALGCDPGWLRAAD